MKRKSRWNKKIKKWLDQESKKKHIHKAKVSKHTKNIRDSFVEKRNKKNYVNATIILPEDFSFLSNPETTMETIDELIREIKREEFRKVIFIDAKNVKHVTVDAIIYLIAIMENDCINRRMQYTYVGSFPNNEKAMRVFRESGFMSYVKSRVRKLPASTSKMQIISGNKNDPNMAKKCCMFVMECLGKQRVDMIPLQAVFIELMSNVYHHAYEDNEGIMLNNWYIYAEHKNDKVEIVFVDTGVGIARTVRKSFKESISSLFTNNPQDSELLKSTLQGDFRTETGEKYRGNGLSRVMEKIISGAFSHFEVISGHGRCLIDSEDGVERLTSENYNGKIYGTLYSFEMN